MQSNQVLKYFIRFLCLVVVLVYSSALSANQPASTTRIISDINTVNIGNELAFFDGDVIIKNREFKFRIKGLILNPKQYKIAVAGLNPKTYSGNTLLGFQKKTSAIAVITGGFRSAQNLPLGLVIEDGEVFNRLVRKPSVITGILTIKHDQIDILRYSKYQSSENYQYALQSGPIIVEKGGINGIRQKDIEIRRPYSRSFIAIQNTGSIVLALTTSVYLYDLAEFLRDTSSNGLNCNVALNLEGGGGEGLIINTQNMSKSFGNVVVRRPNAIIVKQLSTNSK